MFKNGAECVEPKLYSGARARGYPIENMSVYSPKQGRFLEPCRSCAGNEKRIVTGEPETPPPLVPVPQSSQEGGQHLHE